MKTNEEQLKCTNCGKKLVKSLMSIECPNCYVVGCNKEVLKHLQIQKQEFEKMIDEDIELSLQGKIRILLKLNQKSEDENAEK